MPTPLWNAADAVQTSALDAAALHTAAWSTSSHPKRRPRTSSHAVGRRGSESAANSERQNRCTVALADTARRP
eukprot:4605313-Pleurochrysis_carterae.AAC.4